MLLVTLFLLNLFFSQYETYSIRAVKPAISWLRSTQLKMESTPQATAEVAPSPEIPPNESPEEKYKREKLTEIAERKAAEVFVTRSTGKYECQACGYVYSEVEGYPKRGFLDHSNFRLQLFS